MAITLTGVPAWIEQGPGPLTDNTNVTNIGQNDAVGGGVEAISAVDANTVYIATINGGVWRGTNFSYSTFDGVDNDGDGPMDGADPDELPNWTPLTDQAESLAASAIAVSPLSASTIFAGTGSFSAAGGDGGQAIGILRSTDGGATWQVVGRNLIAGERVRSVVPTSINSPGPVVMAATIDGGGLYRSTNGGDSWTLISGTSATTDGIDNDGDGTTDEAGELNLPLGDVSHLVADPGNASRFYLAIPGQTLGGAVNSGAPGIYRSDNAGANWRQVNTGIPGATLNNARIELSISAAGTNPVYAAFISAPANDAIQAVFRTTNQGGAWRQIQNLQNVTPGNQGTIHFSIEADPSSATRFYIAGDRAAATPFASNIFQVDVNDGTPALDTWTSVVDGGANNTAGHADSRDMAFIGGHLIDVNDGGIVRLRNPTTGGQRWESVNGNLAAVEVKNISLNNRNNANAADDRIAVGNQDNGAGDRVIGTGPGAFATVVSADGEEVASDDLGDRTYFATQNMRTFRSRAGGGASAAVAANIAGAAGHNLIHIFDRDGDGTNEGFDNIPFSPQFATNAVAAGRFLVGTTANLYESTDSGGTFTSIGGLAAGTADGVDNDNDGATDEAGEMIPVNVPNLAGTVTTMAYGGRQGGANNPDVAWIGTNSAGGQIFTRTAAAGAFTATTYAAFANTDTPLDIALDPENWARAFVVDNNGVFMTPDGGATWSNITGNLLSMVPTVLGLGAPGSLLNTIAFATVGAMDVVLVGGVGGVFRNILGSGNQWTEYGVSLPNTSVQDIEYDRASDALVAGTLGRGAWSIASASTTLTGLGVLEICGDENFANQDDIFRLVRNAGNPTLLDIFINNNTATPNAQYQLSAIQQINVFGAGGNDNLIVDSTNGLITVPNGIRYNGDDPCPGQLGAGVGGFDTLTLQQTGGAQLTDTLVLGATPGSGRSTIVGTGGTQRVDFEKLEPILDNVPAATFNITSVGGGIASLLQDDNQITYLPGAILPNSGRVEIDDFEPIEFSNKTRLIIDAGSGDDTIVATNGAVPAGLQSIVINGQDGNDDVRLQLLPAAGGGGSFVDVTVNGDAGHDSIDAGAIATTTRLLLSGGLGDDTIVGDTGADGAGGVGADTYDGGDGVDVLVFRGTSARNLIDVFQNAPIGSYTLSVVNGLLTAPPATTVETIASVGGVAGTAGALPTIEQIRIEALAGDDVMRVGHSDNYIVSNISAQTIAFDVDGGPPNANDRLAVRDDGLGDLVIQRLGSDNRSGSFTVGATAPIEYSGVEFAEVVPLDTITGGTGTNGLGRLVVFKNDVFESNNSLATAWFLGSGVTINADPTIDPGGFDFPPAGSDPFDVPGDSDYFRFVAQETGTLDFQIYFRPIGTLANGRAGLPGSGELVVTVFDVDGNPLGGIGTGSNLLDPSGVKIGERIAIPVVRNQTYFLRVMGQTADSINVYNFTAINIAAPVPQLVDLQAASDSGRHNSDDITKIATATFDIILDDDRVDEFTNRNLAPDTVNDDAQTAGFDYGVQVFNNAVSIGFAFYTGIGNRWQFTATAGDLIEGSNNFISGAVWIRDPANPAQIGRHELSVPLQITLDTITPPVSFGLPTTTIDGLHAESDTGVTTAPETFADRVTSDTTPKLWGRAEADTIIRVFLDRDGDGFINLAIDTFLGQTVAVPLDGNNAYPEGYWELTSVHDLNQIVGLPKDGLRRLLVTAEDVAGNPTPINSLIVAGVDLLQIFIDTQGPRVTEVTVNDLTTVDYDLFDPKPSTNGHTPLVDSLVIHFFDLPSRLDQVGTTNDFLYEALQADIASTSGNYVLVGDHVGTIAIRSIFVINDPRLNNNPATATVVLNFFAPLPDDRYTLRVRDNLVDPANNKLDGESNAAEPQEDPFFPSGDGVPGGDFVARFTIDSRPEIGAAIAQGIQIDINGNFVWDPANGQIGNDTTNVDLAFELPAFSNGSLIPGGLSPHDLVIAGKFTPRFGDSLPERLFDQLAAYGNYNGVFRWLIDLDSDGVVYANGDPDGSNDIIQNQGTLAGFDSTARAGAIPIAGNFDRNAENGDEIGLYYAGTWALDTNHNYILDKVITSNLLGYPIVGNFDGDSDDDLAVFNNNQFFFDVTFNALTQSSASVQHIITWGFPGVLDRPVAADMDQDGIDDIGLWVPRNGPQPERIIAEWYFLVSNDFQRIGSEGGGGGGRIQGQVNTLNHPFSPVPFGADLFAEFGDELALPIVGNFDPPVAASAAAPALPGDYDRSGFVDQADYTLWNSTFGSTTILAADGNHNGRVDAADYTVWRNHKGSSAAAMASLTGDYNHDGVVDGADYSVFVSSIGSTTNLAADGNGDGMVNAADYTIWRNHLGSKPTIVVGSSAVANGEAEAATISPSVSATSFQESLGSTTSKALNVGVEESVVGSPLAAVSPVASSKSASIATTIRDTAVRDSLARNYFANDRAPRRSPEPGQAKKIHARLERARLADRVFQLWDVARTGRVAFQEAVDDFSHNAPADTNPTSIQRHLRGDAESSVDAAIDDFLAHSLECAATI